MNNYFKAVKNENHGSPIYSPFNHTRKTNSILFQSGVKSPAADTSVYDYFGDTDEEESLTPIKQKGTSKTVTVSVRPPTPRPRYGPVVQYSRKKPRKKGFIKPNNMNLTDDTISGCSTHVFPGSAKKYMPSMKRLKISSPANEMEGNMEDDVMMIIDLTTGDYAEESPTKPTFSPGMRQGTSASAKESASDTRNHRPPNKENQCPELALRSLKALNLTPPSGRAPLKTSSNYSTPRSSAKRGIGSTVTPPVMTFGNKRSALKSHSQPLTCDQKGSVIAKAIAADSVVDNFERWRNTPGVLPNSQDTIDGVYTAADTPDVGNFNISISSSPDGPRVSIPVEEGSMLDRFLEDNYQSGESSDARNYS